MHVKNKTYLPTWGENSQDIKEIGNNFLLLDFCQKPRSHDSTFCTTLFNLFKIELKMTWIEGSLVEWRFAFNFQQKVESWERDFTQKIDVTSTSTYLYNLK